MSHIKNFSTEIIHEDSEKTQEEKKIFQLNKPVNFPIKYSHDFSLSYRNFLRKAKKYGKSSDYRKSNDLTFILFGFPFCRVPFMFQ